MLLIIAHCTFKNITTLLVDNKLCVSVCFMCVGFCVVGGCMCEATGVVYYVSY